MTDSNNTCATCRHHSKSRRPRPLQAVVNGAADYVGVAFADVDEVVYICRAPRGASAPYAGQEVGFEPVNCSTHEPGRKLSSADAATLNEAVARVGLRLAARREADDE